MNVRKRLLILLFASVSTCIQSIDLSAEKLNTVELADYVSKQAPYLNLSGFDLEQIKKELVELQMQDELPNILLQFFKGISRNLNSSVKMISAQEIDALCGFLQNNELAQEVLPNTMKMLNSLIEDGEIVSPESLMEMFEHDPIAIAHVCGLQRAIFEDLGTAALPTYSFRGDTDTGMYHSAADEVSFACGGVNQFTITTSGVSGITFGNGTEALPSITFASDIDTGMYRPAANTIGLTAQAGDVLRLVGAATTENYITIKNAAVGADPSIASTGDTDVSIGLDINSLGSGAITLLGGNGPASGNAGGAVELKGGTGNAAGVSAGGGITLLAGTGGATDGTGGAVSLTAGASGATLGAGGAISLTAGNSAVSGAGGAVTITSGNGATAGSGGNISLLAGNGAGAGTDGSVNIDGGTGGATDGSIVLGNVNPTAKIQIGNTTLANNLETEINGLAIDVNAGTGRFDVDSAGTTATAINFNTSGLAGGTTFTSTAAMTGTFTVALGSGADSTVGGAVSLTAGAGGATLGAGGAISLTAGNSAVSGAGGAVTITSGNGATAGSGGNISLLAGNGAGAGTDGSVNIDGGTGGATDGSIVLGNVNPTTKIQIGNTTLANNLETEINGTLIDINGGTGGVLVDSSATGASAIDITALVSTSATAISINTATGATDTISGGIQIVTGAGGVSSGAPAAGASGVLSLATGTGGAQAGAGAAGLSGAVTLASGNGGAGTATGTGAAAGDVNITAGNGGNTAGAGTGGLGGDAILTGGAGGATVGGTSGAGGKATVQAGNGGSTGGGVGTAGAGANAELLAGNGGVTAAGTLDGAGGAITITAGNAGGAVGNPVGGNVTITSGNGGGTGANGTVAIDTGTGGTGTSTINIGATNATAVNLARNGEPATISGILNLSNNSSVTGASITCNRSVHILTDAAIAVDTISAAGHTAGDWLVLLASGATPTINDGTGNIRLVANFVFTGDNDTLTLIFDGTNWLEISRSING